MRLTFSILLLLSIIYPRECLIQYDPNERPVRPEKQTFAISPSGHFYIHYDTTGNAAPDLIDIDSNNIPDYIDEVGGIADSAHHVLIYMMDYESEPSDGTEGGGVGKYDIYIMSYSPGMYGFCTHEGSGTSYLKIDNDYIGYNSNFNQTPLEIMQISLVHEYFHAIQFGYRVSLSGNTYFYEMSSTWFEDVMIPDGNEYIDGWVDPLLNNPTADFDDTGNGYELALFGHYLSSFLDPDGVDNVNNSTIIREMWERFSDTSSNALSAVNYVLDGENYSLTFIEAWVDFMSRNLYNGLDENFYYYDDQALIDPISTYSSPLSDSEIFSLEIDNESAAIQSYSIGGLESILTVDHMHVNFIGRIALVSTISDNETNKLIWGNEIIDETISESIIHFVYGVEGSSSITLPIEIFVSTVPFPPAYLTATAAQDSIILYWNSSLGFDDNSNYIIYRNGDSLDVTANVYYVDSKEISGFSNYIYNITCFNETGMSLPSNSINVLSWPTENNVLGNDIISIYPNPVSKTNDLHILYALGSYYSKITLELFNIRGQIVTTTFLQSIQQGWHREEINGLVEPQCAEGIYFVRLRTDNDYSGTQKITIIH